MIQFSPDKSAIRELVRHAELILSSNFVVNNLQPPLALINEFKEHPLRTYKRSLLHVLDETKGERLLNYTFDAMKYMNFCLLVCSCEDNENLSDVLIQIIDRNSFHDAFYELTILGIYSSNGMPISKIIEPEVGKGICDFVVNINDKKIYIECKNLENKRQNQINLIKQLANRLEALTKKKSLSIKVEFSPPRLDMTGALAEEIYSAINRNIMGQGEKNISLSNDTVNMTISSSARGQSELSLRLDKFQNINKKVCNLIRRARKKQLPPNEPGIIYINMPASDGTDFLFYIDLIYDDIYQMINNNSTRIHSIVLTSQILQGGGESPIEHKSIVIPNHNSSHTLPDEFMMDVLGEPSVTIGISHNQEKGSFKTVYVKPDDWEQPVSETFFFQHHKHGRSQFYLWRKWDHTLRFEIVREGFKRLYVDTSPVEFNSSHEITIKGRWNRNSIGLSINGVVFSHSV